MGLSPGARLGPYEIVAPLGAGGMGEVWRARDTRLDRAVAIKVLPAHFAADADRRARFEREAKTISALNHPHICTLHDIGEQDGLTFLVMEHLEGESLAQRLEKGPLPLEHVLRVGIEVADALARAHRQGIVHRDLKPGNVMLTKSGAKLLDFGLAKSQAPGASGLSVLSQMPTGERPLTTEGTLLGTFQFMAPEQLEGREADARSDIWALGCVLYEMATGRRAFAGKSHASLIGAIMHSDPPTVSSLQPMTPPALDRAVRRCLAKDPEDRWDTAHDLAEELRWVASGASQAGAPVTAVTVSRRSTRLAWGLAALMTTAVAALLPLALRPRPALTGRRIVASLLPPEQAAFSSLSGPMALSPDGRQLAFVARGPGGKTMLWLRSLDGETARAVAGTEGAFDPFWSPDGRFVAFFARGKLWRIEAQGGEAKALADSRDSAGGAWAPDGTILFANVWGGGSLMRIEPNGKVSPLIDAHGTSNRRWPHFLPGGRRFLYTVVSQFGSEDGIYLGSLDSSESRRVVPAVSNAVYAEPGIVLYWRDGDLRARRLEAAGAREEDERVAEQVQFDPDRSCALFSAGAGGLLAYRSGGRAGTSELVFVDRAGRDLASLGAPAYYYSPRLSRDGRRLAVDISDPLRANGDIWIFDVARGVSSRFTHDPANESSPLWSPDDRQIVFFRGLDLYRRASSAAAGEELLLGSADLKRASDWSEDGRFLLFSPLGTQRNYDIWVLSIADSKARPWLSTAFNEEGARLSPDGRWIAYTSDESSRFEVYVQGFPEPGEKVLVSVSGGGSPVWRRDGKELFYQAADGKLMAVPVKTSPRFEAEAPRSLFDAPVRGPIGIVPHQYDVSADGQRFLLNRMSAESAAPITLIQGWAAGLPGSR